MSDMADEAPHLSDTVRERFAARAHSYRASAVHAGGHDLQRLVRLVEAEPGTRALDIATGAGHVAVALAETGARVTASDLTPDMLDETRDNLAAHGVWAQLEVADALDLPFSEDSFDVVTVRMAPHHFPDAGAFVAEVARVLRPGGRFGLEDQLAPLDSASAETINRFEVLRDPSHHHQLSMCEWQTVAGNAGLTVEHIEVIDKWVEFDWWTSLQDVSDEVRVTISMMLADGPAQAREWYTPSFRDNGLIGRFRIPHVILLASKPD